MKTILLTLRRSSEGYYVSVFDKVGSERHVGTWRRTRRTISLAKTNALPTLIANLIEQEPGLVLSSIEIIARSRSPFQKKGAQ